MAGNAQGAQKRAAAELEMTLQQYAANLNAGLKRCRCCKTWKDRSEYANDRSRGDGKKTKCFACDRVKVRAEPYFKKGEPSRFKGRRHSLEARAMMTAQRMGNQFAVGHTKTPAQWAVVNASAHRLRASKGPANVRWKGGVTHWNHLMRGSAEYIAWRKAVYERDSYTCRRCGDSRGGNLHAHHIKPFATHPELRFEIDNGLTLCEPCHESEHFKADSLRNTAKARRAA